MGGINLHMPTIPIAEISLKEFKRLQTGSISIDNILDHINPTDKTFDYKGQKVLLHQATKILPKRFHCSNVQIPYSLLFNIRLDGE